MTDEPEDRTEDLELEADHASALRGFVVGMVVGTLAGASMALLLAPERGKILRRRIGRKARRAGRDASVRLDVWRRESTRRHGRRRREPEPE